MQHVKREDVNPMIYNGHFKKTWRSLAHWTKALTWMGVDSVDSKRQINKLNGNIEEGWNISFSYKSTQEFDSLFNCARGSGFHVAISVSWNIQWKRKIEKQRDRKSEYSKRERKARKKKKRSRYESDNWLKRRSLKQINSKIYTHTFLILHSKTNADNRGFPTVTT